ncbi:Carnitine O-acetyltransferase mitochondrial [Maudiozyma exigua]|uniref:Carnitine O-acetyltransferase, mitochondrial n=1 Tax=Maudiozyma exigua TaxID=34358 RepID=A0A9P7BBD5_MAUEX|nr:Carnitine O-acetyltransferase mitochondrial [Kazachstania exigua]
MLHNSLVYTNKQTLKKLLMTRSFSGSMTYKVLNKFPMVTENGEHYWAHQENSIHQKSRPNFKGETFHLQEKLPSLPVPELNETIAKYLQSVKPYIKGKPDEFSRQKFLCQDFLENEGPVLQDRLLKYSKGKRNWMSTFWDNQAYLEYNDPVIPYVSYFFSHKPLPSTHAQIQNDPLLKATAIVVTATKFIEAIKDESLPAELAKGNPFCMNSFQLMFNSSRLPGDPANNRDTNIFYSIYENNFIVVAYKGNFYKILTHDTETKLPLTANEIWQQMYSVVNGKQGQNVRGSQKQSSGIGALTSLPRDRWRTAYAEVIKDPLSKEALETIHQSSFVLCLDLDKTPVTLEEKSRNCWHGDGVNRFFDKSVQFFVTGNGTSGFLGEHSKMDGTPTLFLNNYICQELNKLDPEAFIQETRTPSDKSANLQPEALTFTVTPKVQEYIASAKLQFNNVMKQQNLKVWHYNRYGKNFIKTQKMSPDAYLQQIIQLAIYKYLGKQLPTYEAASTRKFFKGRTETGRSVSEASQKFVESWDNPKVSNSERVQLLRDSAAAHATYLKMASEGEGVDRHFFGLKNMINAEQDNETVPALFRDPLFNYSSTWLISTSQLTSEHFDGYGWSQVNDIGYGLAYMLNKEWLHINIVNKPGYSGLTVDRLHHYLNVAADEMADALIKDSTKAKL